MEGEEEEEEDGGEGVGGGVGVGAAGAVGLRWMTLPRPLEVGLDLSGWVGG